MTLADGRIFYLEQKATDLPDNDDWLSSAEHLTLKSLGVPKRRADWRLGRWTAKRAVSAYLGWSNERLQDIEIRPLPSGAPEVAVPPGIVAPSISISHSSDVCLCVVGPSGIHVGCDIEKLEIRSQSFIETFFTRAEAAALAVLSADEKKIIANLVWSAKESYLKSTREGLTRDTREVVTTNPELSQWKPASEKTSWFPIAIADGRIGSVVYGRLTPGFVETLCRPGAAITSITNLSELNLFINSRQVQRLSNNFESHIRL